jgi:hypothetical protein
MPFSEIHDIKIGCNKSAVLRKNKVPEHFDHLVFSIHSTQRTLDLKAESEEIRNKWVFYLNSVIFSSEKKCYSLPLRYLHYLNKWQNATRVLNLQEIWEQTIQKGMDEFWDKKLNLPKKS